MTKPKVVLKLNVEFL